MSDAAAVSYLGSRSQKGETGCPGGFLVVTRGAAAGHASAARAGRN